VASVAADLRRSSTAAVLALPPEARIALALRLGDEDAALYALFHGIDPAEARETLARRRRRGRRPSRCAEGT
jgi:hypothetical protein